MQKGHRQITDLFAVIGENEPTGGFELANDGGLNVFGTTKSLECFPVVLGYRKHHPLLGF